MDYEYEDPAAAEQQEEDGDQPMMEEDEEDIPVTQEDAWAVIRYVIHYYICLVLYLLLPVYYLTLLHS